MYLDNKSELGELIWIRLGIESVEKVLLMLIAVEDLLILQRRMREGKK